MSSFINLIEGTVNNNADRTFATWYNDQGDAVDEYSFSTLWQEAGIVAYHLRVKYELRKGDRVVLCYSFGLKFFASFIGCIRAGVTAVLIYPPSMPLTKSLPKMLRVVDDCDARLILIDSTIQALKFVDKANPLSKSRHLWPTIDFKVHDFKTGEGLLGQGGGSLSFDENVISKSDVAFLQYTSGSTGDPKGVMVTYGALEANVKALIKTILDCHKIADDVKDSSSDATTTARDPYNIVGFSWLPQYHDMGLVQAIVAPFVGGMQSHMISPISFIKNPLLWLDLISKLKVTWTLAPDFGYRLVARKFKEAKDRGIYEPIPNLDLSSIVAMQNAAEPIRRDTHSMFEELFLKYNLSNSWFFAGYGLAETVVYASHLHDCMLSTKGTDTGTELFAVGHRSCFPQSQIVKVVDPETKCEVEDGTIGELWLSGPSITGGYFGKEDLTEEVFKAKVTGSDMHFLRTGDLAFFEDEYLYICGRQKDLIIVNGVNYYPQDIEFSVQDASPLIRPGCVAAFSSDDTGSGTGNLEIVFEIRDQASKEEAANVVNAVKIHISNNIGLLPTRVVAIKERTILKTTSGKIQRRANRTALHDDKHWIISELTGAHQNTIKAEADTHKRDNHTVEEESAETVEAFDRIVMTFFGANYDPDLSWDELGMSSIASVQLRDAIYDSYTVTLPPDCFEKYATPNQLKDYILGSQGIPIEQIVPPLDTIRSTDLPWFARALLQALGSILLLFIFSFSIVPCWYVGKYMTDNYSQSVERFTPSNQSVDIVWLWFPIVVPTWMVSFSILTVLAKWIVIGKYQEGVMSASSAAFVRWWFVDRFIALWESWVGIFIKDTLLINCFYILMGARIHHSAAVDAYIREFDLVKIGKHASIEHQIRCRTFREWSSDNDLLLAFCSITVDANSVVKGMLCPGSTVLEKAIVEKFAVVPEGGQVCAGSTAIGNPAFLLVKADKDATDSALPPTSNSWLIFEMMKLAWLLLELYLFFGIFFLGQYLWLARLPLNWRYFNLLSWFLILAWFSFGSVVTSIILKWILIGKRKPGPYKDTIWRKFADWATDWHFFTASLLLYSITSNSRIWNIILMLHGMDIDFKSTVQSFAFPPSKLDLVCIRDSFLSASISFDVRKGNQYHLSDIKCSSVGFSVHVGHGVTIANKIVPPQTFVSSSLTQNEPDSRFPNRLTLRKVVVHESLMTLWYLVFFGLIFVHLIPCYELWMTVFAPDSIWIAVVALSAALVIQTLTFIILLLIWQSIVLLGARESKTPWNNKMYLVGMDLAYAGWLWSVVSVTVLGSPVYNMFLRILGVRFEGRAVILEGRMYEHPLLTLSDKIVVDQSPGITGHYVIYNKITIGPCKVGGVIHEGTYAANALITSKESGPWRTFIGTYNELDNTSQFINMNHSKAFEDSFDSNPTLNVGSISETSRAKGDPDERTGSQSDWV